MHAVCLHCIVPVDRMGSPHRSLESRLSLLEEAGTTLDAVMLDKSNIIDHEFDNQLAELRRYATETIYRHLSVTTTHDYCL